MPFKHGFERMDLPKMPAQFAAVGRKIGEAATFAVGLVCLSVCVCLCVTRAGSAGFWQPRRLWYYIRGRSLVAQISAAQPSQCPATL